MKPKLKKTKKSCPRSSEILMGLVHDKNLKGDLTYKNILDALGDRAFGIALLFFALPTALPFSAIPGVSVVFSIPILLFSFQIILGRKTLWLPKFLAQRTISQKKVVKIILAAVPYLAKIERLLKPRWSWLSSRGVEIMSGVTIFYLALVLTLPIPFSNFIISIIIIIFSLGIAEKDGLFIMIGYLSTFIYTGFIFFIIQAAINALLAKFF